jgi:hypothetical protein
MEEIRKQVQVARRRLLVQQFLAALPWCLFATLLIATVAIAVPKFFPLSIDADVWMWSWIGGAVGLGVVTALAWTLVRGHTTHDAAWEIDHRFGLKERVSSVLALSDDELETEAGRALAKDAVRRAGGIDINERFGVALSRKAWLPLAPAVVVFCLAMFVQDKGLENPADAATSEEVKQQVKKSTEVLRRRIAEHRKKAQREDLKAADDLFKKLEEATKKLEDKKDLDPKKAMAKLNDLAQELEARKKSMGAGEKMKDQLDRLKNIKQGPAEKLAKAMREGDFQKALDELRKLQNQIKNGDMDDAAKQAMAEQLKQMQNKLQEMADAHQQAKADLQEQIKQQQAAGNLDAASKLQQQLDKLAGQQPQIDALKDLADKLGECSKCAGEGDAAKMAAALDQLAQDFEKLGQQLEEMQMLEDVMEQIAQAKDSMRCEKCGGGGCKACNGQGQMPGQGQGGQGEGGDGLGAAKAGFGQRPEEENDTKTRDSLVRQNPGRGKAVITDLVDGPNIKGTVRESIKSEIDAARAEEADPLTGQRLPKNVREHARQYFDSFREGE